MSVCPSSGKKLVSLRADFHEILYSNIFRKFVQKIQLSLKSDKTNWHLTVRPIYVHLTVRPIYIHLTVRPLYVHMTVRPIYVHFTVRPIYVHLSVRPI